MATATRGSAMQRIEQNLQKTQDIKDPQQVQGQLSALPLQAVYEARYALQQVKETGQDPQFVAEVTEPLARIVGWTEALVFAFDTTKEREVLKHFTQNGSI